MRNCFIAHYPEIEFSKELILMKLQKFEILKKAKKVRGANRHEEQCLYIPSL